MNEAKDISVETERTYTFPGGDTLTIREPQTLAVSESGGHRIVASGGRGYYVAPTWLHIAWTVNAGSPVTVA